MEGKLYYVLNPKEDYSITRIVDITSLGIEMKAHVAKLLVDKMINHKGEEQVFITCRFQDSSAPNVNDLKSVTYFMDTLSRIPAKDIYAPQNKVTKRIEFNEQ